MNDQTIKAIVEEVTPLLAGRSVGKLFELTRASLAIDFRPGDGRYLYLSAEPAQPGIYLIERRVRELEKQSLSPSPFALLLRKQLSGAVLASLMKDEGDRIVRLSFRTRDEIGQTSQRTLVAQLTGRAANLLLLNEQGHIIETMRPARGPGQQAGEPYSPPPPRTGEAATRPFERGQWATLSAALDDYHNRLAAERIFDNRAAQERARLQRELARREKLRQHLADDLQTHGDAEAHKRIGDLLLANLANAERHGRIVRVKDYYADDAPIIELEIDEQTSLQEEAAHRFARYTKARRAGQEIAQRLAQLGQEVETLRARQAELEQIIKARDEAALAAFSSAERPQRPGRKKQQKSVEAVPGARRYRSSDGYEILVGRAARDNDQLTFRVARPHDLWLHAADYPGSHVIVRNHTRAEIPQRTIIEAAQLAALFSHAKRDAKVDVHYTQRKFLSKPKGAAPGLVRMSSFRTMTVAPQATAERI